MECATWLGVIRVHKLPWDLFFSEGTEVSNILTVGKEIPVASQGVFCGFFWLQLDYLNVLVASENIFLVYVSVLNVRNVCRKLIYFSDIYF